MNEVDITKLPIIEKREYWPPTERWQGQKKIVIEPESEAVAEVNRKMEQWMQEQYSQIMASFWKDGEVVSQPKHMRIYLCNSDRIADILLGRKTPNNIPHNAVLYDIRPWEHSHVFNTFAFWMTHPEFGEYRSGDHVEAVWMLFD